MAGTVRPANAIDQTRRMLSLVTYLRERPGARVEDVARAFGITEDELISDLDVLPHVRDQLPRRRPARHRHRRRPDLVAQPRRRRRAAAARRRRGDRAAGGRPRRGHPARAARGRPAGAAAGHRQAGGRGGRGGGRQLPALGHLRVRGRCLRRRRPGDLRAAPAVDALLLARARRAHRARGRPDPAVRVGHTYVEAWCRLSEARRTFRLDRVAEIKLLDEPSAPPEVELRDLSEGLVQPAAEDPEVVIEVGPGGRWVAEYYPHDSAEELPDGGLRITLRAPDPASLRRLALRLGRDGRIVVAAGPRGQRPAGGPGGARGVRRTAGWTGSSGRPVRQAGAGAPSTVRGSAASGTTAARVRGGLSGRRSRAEQVGDVGDDVSGASAFSGMRRVVPWSSRPLPDCRAGFELAANALRLAIGATSGPLSTPSPAPSAVRRSASRPGSGSSNSSPAEGSGRCGCTRPV